VAGSPGSRSKARIVGLSGSAASESEVCSSRSARLASHMSVGRSSHRQNEIAFDDICTFTVLTQSGRCDGQFFS
jgi:hypothetical protein